MKKEKPEYELLISAVRALIESPDGAPDDDRLTDDARVCWYCRAVLKSDLNDEYWNDRAEPHRFDCHWDNLRRAYESVK